MLPLAGVVAGAVLEDPGVIRVAGLILLGAIRTPPQTVAPGLIDGGGIGRSGLTLECTVGRSARGGLADRGAIAAG